MKAFDFLVKADTSKLPTFATKEETEVLCELMEQYANQRVIEELEKLEEDSSDYVEWQGGHGMFVPIEDIQEIIEQLKQEQC